LRVIFSANDALKLVNMNCVVGFLPSPHDGKETDVICVLSDLGGMLITSSLISLSHTACKCSAMQSICQLCSYCALGSKIVNALCTNAESVCRQMASRYSVSLTTHEPFSGINCMANRHSQAAAVCASTIGHVPGLRVKLER